VFSSPVLSSEMNSRSRVGIDKTAGEASPYAPMAAPYDNFAHLAQQHLLLATMDALCCIVRHMSRCCQRRR
jgi:hypothetical protein